MARTPKPLAPRHLLEELMARQQKLIQKHLNELSGKTDYQTWKQ
jgi:hypothetical protein